MNSSAISPSVISSASGYASPLAASSGNSTPDAPTSLPEFRQLLTLMLLSSFSSSGSSGDSMGMGALMMPVMLQLMEKLLAQSVESEPEGEPETPENDTPQGKPLEGPITQVSHPGHVALDFGVPVGTEVHATMSGTVVYSGWNDEGYGNLVIVENGPYRTYYAHLSELPVQAGQTVHAGDTIGLSGNTGNSTGPHLHYEVRLDGQQIDPTSFTMS